MAKKKSYENMNPLQKWFYNLTHVKKNLKKVRASPYASLSFGLKVRKAVIIPLIGFLIYQGINMIINYRGHGFMQWFGRIFMFGVFAYMIYKIWRTIPAAKKQIEYYKKYPHTINYCPTNSKEDIDSIITKIKSNQLKEQEVKNVSEKSKTEKAKSSSES